MFLCGESFWSLAIANELVKNAPDLTRPDFSEVPPEAIKELHRQGEACLQGTIQLAVAADQRATTMAGILGSVSAAILTVAVMIATSAVPNWSVMSAAVATATVLFIGALFAAIAARPCDFQVAGYEPKRMAYAAQSETWIPRYATEDLQVRIDANRIALDKTARFLNWGLFAALFALPAGVIVFLGSLFDWGCLHFFERDAWFWPWRR